MMDRLPNHPILFFDGACNLCNGLVQWVIDRDKNGQINFASLQSDYARDFKIGQGLDPEAINTFLYLKEGKCYSRSSAALQLAGDLGGAYRLFAIGYLLPVSIRDCLYSFVADHRYKWFGRTTDCRLPDPALRKRFIT